MNSDSKKRLASTRVICPIVYGSIAHSLSKKNSNNHATHSWMLFVRGPNNEDLSSFVAKVAFTLHPSFDKPVREVYNHPFCVEETGWGEFEAGIRIFFRDDREQPVDLFHTLRLYPTTTNSTSTSLAAQKKPVVYEQYDEVVFSEPTQKFYQQLMAYSSPATDSNTSLPATETSLSKATKPSIYNEYSTIFDDSLDLERLTAIQLHLTHEIQVAKNELLLIESQLVDLAYSRRLEQEALEGSAASLELQEYNEEYSSAFDNVGVSATIGSSADGKNNSGSTANQGNKKRTTGGKSKKSSAASTVNSTGASAGNAGQAVAKPKKRAPSKKKIPPVQTNP